MRLLLVLLAVVLLVPSLAEARTGACRTGDVPRVKARMDRTKVGYRYAVVACDAERQMRVLRRTRYRFSARRGDVGRQITDAEAAGGRVVWAEVVYRRRKPMRAVVVEADRRGRVTRRRTVWSRRADPNLRLDVAAFRDGSVAWSVPRNRERGVVVLSRPGRRPRTLAPAYVGFLGADDGRTLRWETSGSHLVLRDLLPVPLRDGCPRRPGYLVVTDTPSHRVTVRGFAIEDNTRVDAVHRVCIRAERRDAVVAQSLSGVIDEVPLIAGRWAVVTRTGSDKYDGCTGERVEVVSLRTGRALHSSYVDARFCRHAPVLQSAHALTAAGRLAWVDPPEPPPPPPFDDEPFERQEVLRATAAGGKAVELDRGEPGAIADLRADGETYRWTHAGEPRSAPAP